MVTRGCGGMLHIKAVVVVGTVVPAVALVTQSLPTRHVSRSN